MTHDTTHDRDRLVAEARRRARAAGDAAALRDLALLELVVVAGLRTADARLLELTDLRLDREGAPVGLALGDGDRDLPAASAASLTAWLAVRAEVLPVGRMLLPDLEPEPEPERELRFGTRRDAPIARAQAEHVVAEAHAAVGLTLPPDAAPSDLGILARAPAGWCEDCGSRWYSQAMVEGLSALDGCCPRCRGELRIRPERATARHRLPAPVDAEPQHVLGAPRPTRRATG